MNQIDWHDIKRVLVIKFRHHGDVLLTTPVFNTIKNHHPEIEVDALVYDETAPMLEGLPALSQLHTVKRQSKKKGIRHQIQQELKLISDLKARQYDLIIHLTEHWRGSTFCRLLKPKYSVVAKYSRRQGKWWKNSFTHHYPTPPTPYHTVEKHLDSLRHLNLHPETYSDLRTTFTIDKQTSEYTASVLKEHGLVPNGYILFHPTSRWLFKCWKESHAAEVIDHLQNAGWRVVLTSGPDKNELNMIGRILKRCETQPINLSGKTNLKQLGSLINTCRLFLGMDSVPMHMAAALEKPVVALFGPSSELYWAPWKTHSEILVDDSPCRPCGLDGCGGSKRSNCLYNISAQQVIGSIYKLLSRTDQKQCINHEAV